MPSCAGQAWVPDAAPFPSQPCQGPSPTLLEPHPSVGTLCTGWWVDVGVGAGTGAAVTQSADGWRGGWVEGTMPGVPALVPAPP